MLKRLKTKTFSIESEPPPTHAEHLESAHAVAVEPSTDAGGASPRSRLIGSLQIVLVLLLMAVLRGCGNYGLQCICRRRLRESGVGVDRRA